MSKIARIMQQASAGAGGEVLDVDDVFSCHLYNGTGGNATITNGIDLSGKGGLVITKRRNVSYNWGWFDTARGANKALHSNDTDPEETLTNGVTAFNSNGFSIGDQAIVNSYTTTDTIGSWTFRKAPKFFDVVTYSGAAYVDQTINHNLGSVPGMIIIKCLSTRKWVVYHRSLGNTKHLHLNTTDAESTVNYFNNTDPTATTFTVEGGDSDVNGYTLNYVAYLFAHNNNDGEFGPDSDQDIIKCGSYTGASQTEISVDLGFEPQWVMIKRATGSSLGVYASWFIQDTMRGMVAKGADAKDKVLYANKSQAEGFRGNGDATSTEIQIHPNATGFTVPSTNSVEVNQAGETYIYMAIRRGPLAEPESATDVFDVTLNPTSPNVSSDTLVDTLLFKSTGSSQSWWVADRLRQGAGNLQTDTTAAESS